MTQTNRDPQELKLHPMLKRQPGEWAADDSRFEKFVDDIREHGIREPITITADGRIADGRHRWRGAKQLQLTSIPCKICADDEVASIILLSLKNRRHFSKGQLAYALAPTLDDAYAESQKRMLSGGKADPRNSVARVPTPAEWAASIGVSSEYLRQARKVYELFADDKKRQFTNEETGKKDGPTRSLREYYEPKIFDADKPMGLGEVLKGAGFTLSCEKKGGAHKGGRPDKEADQLRLFNNLTDTEDNRWEYWPKMSDDAKAEHFKHVRAKALEIDDVSELEARAEYHQRIAKEYLRAAKEATAANGGKK